MKRFLSRAIPAWRDDVARAEEFEQETRLLTAKCEAFAADAAKVGRELNKWQRLLSAARKQLSGLKAEVAKSQNEIDRLKELLESQSRLLKTAEDARASAESSAREWQREAEAVEDREAYIESFLSKERAARLEALKAMPTDEAFATIGVEKPASMHSDNSGPTFGAVLCSLMHVGISKDYGPMMEAINQYLLLPYTKTLLTTPYLHRDRFLAVGRR